MQYFVLVSPRISLVLQIDARRTDMFIEVRTLFACICCQAIRAVFPCFNHILEVQSFHTTLPFYFRYVIVGQPLMQDFL